MRILAAFQVRVAVVVCAIVASSLSGAIADTGSSSFRVRTPVFTTFFSGQTPGFSAGKSPVAIVAGPDGNIWFTELTGSGGTPGIAKITHDGHVTEFPTGTYNSSRPTAIAAGADHNLWFADTAANAIGRITTQGHITLFRRGLSTGDSPAGLATGTDGSLYFVSDGQGPYVGRVSTSGAIVELVHLSTSFRADPSLAQDSIGNLWLTGSNGSNEVLLRIEPNGRVKKHIFALQPGFNPCCVYESPQAVATRRDGSVWFTNLFYVSDRSGSHPLGKIDASGVRLIYTSLEFIGSIARGLGNDLWFAEQDPFYEHAAIGTVGPKGGLRIFALPSNLSPQSITVAPNGTLWMTGSNGSGLGAIIRATP